MMNTEIWGFADPISSWSHFLGALAGFVGTYFLIKRAQGNAWRVFALCVYSFTVVFLFSMSAVFHLLPRETLGRHVLIRLDHAGIWCLIAGTFTPIHSILFRGAWRWLVLLFIWVVAVTGLVLEVVFFTSFPEWLALSFFLGLGWIGALTRYQFHKSYAGQSSKYIDIGAIAYTVGAIVDFKRWFIIWPTYFGHHEFFHIMILLGASSHWLFIYRWANHPISDRFICDVRILANGWYMLSSPNDSISIQSQSLESLKQKAKEEIEKRFHHRFHFEIIFRYFNEEHLVFDRK